MVMKNSCDIEMRSWQYQVKVPELVPQIFLLEHCVVCMCEMLPTSQCLQHRKMRGLWAV